ncbi:response regulator [Cohnella sp. GCM10027633]|uniref:response regulator n=1 Tax=unclassified Cohnella TaxID=2636738 RepID=UPI00362783EC
MYRLLIVDDEPIIVQGLIDLCQQLPEELDIYQAYDGLEALEIARSLRMDIILTDIQMPEMDGIALQRHVLQLWPRCRFLFLTGYNNFNYIQTTVRNGAIDFMLKTEGDEKIVQGIRRAVRHIREEMSVEQLIFQANAQMQFANHSLRRQYLADLLNGDAYAMAAKGRKFAELGIPLHPDERAYAIVGRIDRWREDTDHADKPLFQYAVANIVQELLSQHFTYEHVPGDRNRLVWLLQSYAAIAAEQAHALMLGMLESAQTMCRQYLQIECSFVVSREPYEWEHMPNRFDRLSLLFERGLGIGKEMLLTDERMFASGREEASMRLKRMRLLDQYLVHKDRESFDACFREIVEAVDDPKAMQAGVTLEIFYELAAIFIAHLNRLELFPVVTEQLNIGKLLSIREHDTWPEAVAFFRQLADALFSRISMENERETSELVLTIKEHVGNHIGGDLSLNRLAELVYLTPFYVSRLFKENTGMTITDYIIEARVSYAKKLLAETNLKIHEVGERIGYDSAPYFSRFFKRICRMTPQEFRDGTKRI